MLAPNVPSERFEQRSGPNVQGFEAHKTNMKTALILSTVSTMIVAGLIGRAETAVTIYNQNFAVVRDVIPLDLKGGVNTMKHADTTFHLEPSSVVLRDPTGKRQLQILEQNFRADPISQELLLNLFEGKTIDFIVGLENRKEIVPGKIIRSGYVPHRQAYERYGQRYAMAQQALASPYGGSGQPIIEMEGKLRFGLPGQPLFPSLADDTILKPTLQWIIQSDQDGPLNAELSYVTGGMSWQADYNMMAPEEGNALDVVGWVTMDNQSGKTFQDVSIKLMAGDVSKVQQPREEMMARRYGLVPGQPAAAVEQKTFDEYHLYTLQRKTTLRDRETKQVEFVRASEVRSQRYYVYKGVHIPANRYGHFGPDSIRQEPQYGAESQSSVWVMLEFMNSKENNLGMPLPKGRVRFYRRNTDGALEFTGEDMIGHTPRNETVRFYTGNAFDLVGERKRTDFRIDHSRRDVLESFEITIRNRKEAPAEVRVVEELYRWHNWEITAKTEPFVKVDSRTIEFRTDVGADQAKQINYTVHYTW